MRNIIHILTVANIFLFFFACNDDETPVNFNLEVDKIEIGASGGIKKIAVSSPDSWIASADQPWIMVSPANGRGSANVQVIIDSTLIAEPRTGSIRIQNQITLENRDISITQVGYDFMVRLDETEISLESFKNLEERYFDVEVTSNVEFDIEIEYKKDAEGNIRNWLTHDPVNLELDKGVRPRSTVIRFEWEVNSRPEERFADIVFKPKNSAIVLTEQTQLKVIQSAAQKIIPGRNGDSLAIAALYRALNISSARVDFTDKMDNWEIVEMWKEDDEGYDPLKHQGRVRSVTFSSFSIKEAIPYEIQFLDAAEEISIRTNGNAFLLSLSTGEYITKLTSLKKLTIFSYGLTELHPDFVHLQNLEELDLYGNNFQLIPDILTPDNFPNLKKLHIGGNRRYSIPDLSNTTQTNIGGLNDHDGLPRFLLEWDNLEELSLSYNFMHGEIPKMDDWVKYTAQDIALADTLPQYLVDRQIPKVLPNIKRFAINLNQFTGELPDWLLYHPSLNLFHPYSLVFPQDGWTQEGAKSGFTNEPINLDYYYDIYTSKERPGAATK